MTVSIDYMAS